ncbi:MAG: hypothetical protein LBR81_09830 [Prevotellaceae bacterium]|nr:hypothetical protein [Prevotellaceae bacterium]
MTNGTGFASLFPSVMTVGCEEIRRSNRAATTRHCEEERRSNRAIQEWIASYLAMTDTTEAILRCYAPEQVLFFIATNFYGTLCLDYKTG